MNFAVIDIETTGSNFVTDKITEIGIVKFDGKKIIGEYHSLVNPTQPIPYFITKLTGIDDVMVAEAPQFFEIAKEVIEFTEDCYFVAHNTAFDFGFIKSEFKSLGFDYHRKTFCTVKMSRKLIPGLKSYSLGKLCKSLDISLENHHRALDDAKATAELLSLLSTKEGFAEYIGSPKQKLMAQENITDPLLAKLHSFPETVGIYYFYNKHKEVIYIGKSVNIKKRIFSHLYNGKTQKAIQMKEEVTDFSFQTTHNELIALLIENDEIKKHQPKHNKALKKTAFPFGFITYQNQEGFTKIDLVKTGKNTWPLMAFANKNQALEKLEELEKEYQLCQKINKNEHRIGSCLNRSINLCQGACEGKETPESYNLRVKQALDQLMFKNKNMMFNIETKEQKFGIFIKEGQYAGVQELTEGTPFHFEQSAPRVDRDAHFIINSYYNLYKNKIEEF